MPRTATAAQGPAVEAAASAGVPYRRLFAGIFLLAFATLLFEVSLIRVLSFTIWHHFGYVVISTALLGFGAAGSYLALRPRIGARGFRGTLALWAVCASAAMLAMLGFVAAVPFDPMAILSDPVQAALLIAYQIGAAIPFLFAGLVLSLALREGAARVDRLYFWDLLGGGLGCLAAIGLMNLLTPPGSAVVAAAAMACAGVVFADRRALRGVAAALGLLFLASSPFADRLPFTPTPTKSYSLLVDQLGATPITHAWTALFRTDLLKNPPGGEPDIWGISPSAPSGLDRPAYYLTHDATAGAEIYDLRESDAIDYVPYHIFQFPYRIANPAPRVLVIGVGGGRDMVVAAQMGAAEVTGVELDPVAIRWLREDLNDVTNGFFRRPHIRLVAAEGRQFVRSRPDRYDVIQLTGVDTLSAVNSGAYVLSENYLYTVEAVEDYLDHLSPGGVLSIAMANVDSNAPRAAGRMVSVARTALEARGAPHPDRHIAVIDSGVLYASILVAAEPFSPEQVATLADIAAAIDMSVLLLPGRKGHPVFEGLARAEGPERDALLARLRFRVDATTDDNPFFLSFFRWGGLLEPDTLTPSHVSALTQIVLLALLVSLTGLGAVFILIPLYAFGNRHVGGGSLQGLGVMGFFLAIGLGFMLFEISLIQRFVLFLGYPTYALSVILFSLMVFLGCGSFLSKYLVHRHRPALALAVVAIGALALCYQFGLPWLQDRLLASPLVVRATLTSLLLAPLGLVMGIFFPLGIRVAAAIHPDWVPWAWGINGCASVTAGILAVVLAMSFGFTFVWTLSVVIYALGVAGLLLTTRDILAVAATDTRP